MDKQDTNHELQQEVNELRSEMVELRNLLEEERDQRQKSNLENGLSNFSLPSPGDILHFANEYTIPAIIGLLELNIKLLKGLQTSIRVFDPKYEKGDGVSTTSVVGTAMRKLSESLNDIDIDSDNESLEKSSTTVQKRINSILVDPDETEDTRSDTEKAIDTMEETISESEQSNEDNVDRTETNNQSDDEQNETSVDIQSELESIKREVNKQ